MDRRFKRVETQLHPIVVSVPSEMSTFLETATISQRLKRSVDSIVTRIATSRRWINLSLTQHQSLLAYCEPMIQWLYPQWTTVGHRARVIANRSETADVFSLVLKPSRRWPSFSAGQYVEISMERDGVRQSRIFSISSSPEHYLQTGKIELTIRVQEDGRMTPWMRQSLGPGMLVNLSDAAGEFVRTDQTTPLLFIAGGSGITPFRSILGQLARLHSQQDILLLAYQRDRTHSLFQQELIRYQEQMPNLKVHYLFSDEVGMISEQHLQAYCPDIRKRQLMICGPTPMIQRARDLAEGLGVASEQIRYEFFGAVPMDLAAQSSADSFVRFDRSDRIAETYADDPLTLLEVAEQSGLNPVSGCRSGVCHQCRCTKKSGVVVNLLTGQESDTGQEDIQLCISVARNDVVLDL